MSETSKQLLRRFPKHKVDFIVFTDEKVFTVAPHEHTKQSTPYFHHGQKHISASHLLHTCPTFSHSVMVSVTISKSGSTLLVFVKARTKIEKKCWWSYCSLPDSQSTDDAVHVFQQDISHLLIMHIEQWSCFNWDSQTHCSHHVASQQPDLNAVE